MTRLPKAIVYLLLPIAAALGLATLTLVVSGAPTHAQTQMPTFRIEARYSGLPQVYEGAKVQFQVTGTGLASSTDVTVEVEVWEPNLDDGNGNNPSFQTHRVRFLGPLPRASRSPPTSMALTNPLKPATS